MKKSTYQKSLKIKYNNNTFRVLIRNDKKLGFLKIVDENNEIYEYPSAFEFLHLTSFMNPKNSFKF